MALLARDHRVHVRFIEMMPIGMEKNFMGCQRRNCFGSLGKSFRGFRRMSGAPWEMDRVIIMMWRVFPEDRVYQRGEP